MDTIVRHSSDVSLYIDRLDLLALQEGIDGALVNVAAFSAVISLKAACNSEMRLIHIKQSRPELLFRITWGALSRHRKRYQAAEPPTLQNRWLLLGGSGLE